LKRESIGLIKQVGILLMRKGRDWKGVEGELGGVKEKQGRFFLVLRRLL